MTKKSAKRPTKKSAKTIRKEKIAHQAAESTTALNAVVGVRSGDLFYAVGRTVFQSAARPLNAVKHLSAYGGKLIEIAEGKRSYQPKRGDRRFNDAAWQEQPPYRYLLQSYLAFRESLDEWIGDADFKELDEQRANFILSIFGDSVAPTNTLLGNPAAMRKAMDTKGKSLLQGLGHFVDDIVNNGGMPSQVDKSKFQVGGNIVTTLGSVVFKNEVLELIQYKPATKQVYSLPLLVVPPQINKYYVYDLTPEKSFLGYCVAQGFQTYVISWKNPTAKNSDWGIEKYVTAMLEAIAAIKEITGQKKINLMGACSGGITATILMGYLEAIKSDAINSLSLSVCVLSQHEDDSELSMFVNQERIESARRQSRKKGVLSGKELSRVFNWMRPNDLIWNYVVNNYLLGNKPPAFDVLYWNNDTTNLPAQLHSDYLDIISGNALLKKGGVKITNIAIDVSNSKCEKFIVAGTTDHITPWHACYRNTQILGGDSKFVLSSSGHIQSLINPPGNPKSKYLINGRKAKTALTWQKGAKEISGSWWLLWTDWLQQRSGKKIAVPKAMGSTKYKPLCSAPGEYVLEQSE